MQMHGYISRPIRELLFRSASQKHRIDRSFRCRAASIDKSDRVLIVGGGVGGLATAVALSESGIPVTVLERGDGLREEGAAIGLQQNAWRALEALGVAEDLRERFPRILKFSRSFFTTKNSVLSRVQFLTAEGRKMGVFDLENQDDCSEVRGVLRGDLINSLASKLPSECVQFSSDVHSMDLSTPNRPLLTLKDGTRIQGRVIIGADGVLSRIGVALGIRAPTYRGYCGMRGVSQFRELPIPDQTIHFYFGDDGTRSGMYQVGNENKLYWFLAYNSPERARVESMEQLMEKAKEMTVEFAQPVKACVENVDPSCLSFANIYDRLSNPFSPVGRGTVSLVGDAFHPTTPNIGQGGALALEDSIVLVRTLVQTGGLDSDDDTLCNALRKYEMDRLKRATIITARSRFVGNVFGSGFPPVAALRNVILSKVNMKGAFVSTARYDCGQLMQP